MRLFQFLLLFLLCAAFNPFITEVDEVAKGNRLLKDQKYDEAAKRYLKAQEKRAAELKLKFNLGLVYMGLSKWTDAEKEMIAATGSDNADMRKYANSFAGIIRFHLGEIARNAKDPKDPSKGIKEAQMKYREALDNFKRVLDADPRDDDARQNYELTLERLEELEREKDKQQKQKEEKEKKQQKDQDKKDQNKKDQNKKDQKKDPNKKDQKKDPNKKDQNKDPNKKDQDKNDPNKKDQKNQGKDPKKDQNKNPDKKDQKSQKDPNKKDPDKKGQPKPQNKGNKDGQSSGKQPKPQKQLTPQQRAAQKALRDLKERQRQRMRDLYRRMGDGRRTPIKDW